MIKYHFFILDEETDNQFPGFEKGKKLYSLPLWGNFNIGELQKNINLYSNPFITTKISKPEELKDFFKMTENERLILGRTGNVVAPKWNDLFESIGHPEGIIKLQVGGVPSDLYILGKKELENILSGCCSGKNFISYLFDELLFYNFERIVEVDGYSFLIRHAGEYFKENLKIIRYLREDGFLSLYSHLNPVSSTKTTIGAEGIVKNSVVGNGAVVQGTVENSVIFHGVTVKNGAVVKGSVILPFNCLESRVVIQNTLLLGVSARTIREGSIIGKEGEYVNHDYPVIITKGLTIVGEGFNLPSGSKIGAGCLVTGNRREIESNILVEDGETVRY